MRKPIVFPGSKVILASGETATVAFVNHGVVWVFGRNGLPVPAVVVCDAWGGEADQSLMNVA